jgi:hypothetical protein
VKSIVSFFAGGLIAAAGLFYWAGTNLQEHADDGRR